MAREAQSAESGGIEAAWDAWRARALNSMLAVSCVLGLPMVIPGALGEASLPLKWQVPASAIYLLLLAATVNRNWSFRTRSWILVVAAYLAATVALANRGLVGYGRIGLAVYPCASVVLLGSRAGWGAVAVSLGIYGSFTTLSALGILREWGLGREDSTAPALWLMQGLGLALVIVPTVVLLNRFRMHHMRILEAERRVSSQLQDEVARSAGAFSSLAQEQAERIRLEGNISQLGEEERRRLGQEIHDGLCQQLTAALLRCTALQEQLGRRQIAEAAQAERLRLLIQEMLDGAYVISKGVWPVGPEPDALAPALQAMARRTSDEYGLTCEFRQQGDVAVADDQMAMHLYRIAQEAVSNAVKHAKASRISVLLQGGAEGIALRITDDGCGPPDPTGAARARGMGLSIMTHRARTMGGTLSIARAEGGGTVVSCRVLGVGAGVPKGVCRGS